MAKSKFVYAENWKFMYGSCTGKEVELPFQDVETVKKCIGVMPIYIASQPLTEHPYLLESQRVKSTRIEKMQIENGFVEARTSSGTVYRLITE